VQAVDNGFAGGTFETESSFAIDSIQASKLEGKLVKTNSRALSIKWENGNGERRVVFCKQGSSGTAFPAGNMTYTADPMFGYGDQIDNSGWYCIFNGRGDSTIVTGLSQGVAYSFQVTEYIGTTGSELYYRLSGEDNPGIFSCGLFSEQSEIYLDKVYNSSVTWGDYDNDGDLDVLLTGNNSFESGSASVSKIYSNNGNNSFTEQTGINLFGVQNGSVTYGDYDNDGDLDILLTGTTTGSFPVSKIYRNNGNNTFNEQIGISLIGTSFSSTAWGDYNMDGYLDILLTGQGAGSNLISKIYKNNGNSTFTEQVDINLTRVSKGSAVWGDYDNDGDLDILLTGNNSFGTQKSVSLIYKNNGDNSFTKQTDIILPGVMNSSVAWGDYDNDGDLDILLTGNNSDGATTYISRIYRNNGDNTFSYQSGIKLDGVASSSVAWGDFDNDRDLDILLSGRLISGGFISKIYRNNNNNTFTEVTDISLTGVGYSSVAWGDYDNDGDLDILMTGQSAGSTVVSKIYRNNQIMKAGDYSANKKPAAPGNLTFVRQPDGIKLSWAPVRTDETPYNTLTYNINIVSRQGGSLVFSAQSDSVTGYRRIVSMGNTQLDTSYLVKNLTPGRHYWKVQAVDQGYKGGDWAIGGSFDAKNIQAFFTADTVCSGSDTHFTNQSTTYKEAIKTYSWDFGDGIKSSLKDPAHAFTTSGIYNVALIISSDNDIDTLIKPVFVYPTPVTDFSTEGICQGTETIIENLTGTDGLEVSEWWWDFGDGKGSSERDPVSHGYLNAGSYQLAMAATTDHGCTDTIKKSIIITTALTKPLLYVKGRIVWYLASSNDSAQYYRWYYNGDLIDGANKFLYVANRKFGSYYVSISDNDVCYTASDSVRIPTGITGIEELDPFAGLVIYPNPSSGLFTLEMDNELFGDLNISVVTQNGREIFRNKLEKTTEHFSGQIDLSRYSYGLYFIKLEIKKYSTIRKLIVE
jgi:PKD repeat protein/predicted nucleotidyltransferase